MTAEEEGSPLRVDELLMTRGRVACVTLYRHAHSTEQHGMIIAGKKAMLPRAKSQRWEWIQIQDHRKEC